MYWSFASGVRRFSILDQPWSDTPVKAVQMRPLSWTNLQRVHATDMHTVHEYEGAFPLVQVVMYVFVIGLLSTLNTVTKFRGTQ